MDDSNFTMNAAYRSAMETIAAHERTSLQPVDHAGFFSALDTPPAPTDRLRAAFARPSRPIARRSPAGDRVRRRTACRHRAARSCQARSGGFLLALTRSTTSFAAPNKLTKAGNVRTFVMVGPEGKLIGFYATNAHAIDYTELPELPERFARARPAHGSIPAAYISMIGVDHRFQGRGYGGDLLVDCLARLAGAAEALGIAVVMLDVLNCGDPEKVAKRLVLYTSYGFEPLASNGLRLFLPIATVRAIATQVQ